MDRSKAAAYKKGSTKHSRSVTLAIIPPDDEPMEGRNVRLSVSVWEQLDEISRLETEERTAKAKTKRRKRLFSRNDAIVHLLNFALAHYWEDRGGRPSAKKGNR